MTVFDGEMWMRGQSDDHLNVRVDLTEERLQLMAGDVEVADWAFDEMMINAQNDGFHIRAEGEEIVLEVDRAAEFAVDIGLRNGPPQLVRQMAQVIRQRRGDLLPEERAT